MGHASAAAAATTAPPPAYPTKPGTIRRNTQLRLLLSCSSAQPGRNLSPRGSGAVPTPLLLLPLHLLLLLHLPLLSLQQLLLLLQQLELLLLGPCRRLSLA